jgi:hypothetical protein
MEVIDVGLGNLDAEGLDAVAHHAAPYRRILCLLASSVFTRKA